MTAEEPIPVVIAARKLRRGIVRILKHIHLGREFGIAYALFAVLVLLATALLWATLGARLESHNADQLSDPYLFSNLRTFHGAAFPGAHTMLLKWPIFLWIATIGITPNHLLFATVGLVLVTIGTLAVILYRIDRRPLLFGTVCLGLSLVLLLVPAQPYAGALLPVNMAMLTTRNIEYAVYLLVLGLFARARGIRSWRFVGGVLLLAVLIASDKLFLSLSLGGALLALIVYALLRVWPLVVFAVRWLAGSVLAAVGSAVILGAVSMSHLTHIVNSGSATPYALVTSTRDLVLGVVYSLLGLLTNTGANPVYDNRILRQLPHELTHRLWSLSGPAYVAAAVTLLYALLLAWRVIWHEVRTKPRSVPAANLLALGLIWSTVAALGVFIVTNHSYVVDARYLTVGFFALAVTVSVGLRGRRWRSEVLLTIGCLLSAGVALAAVTSVQTYHTQTAALGGITTRNSVVTAALQRHKTALLVGDYWRVLPIKLAMHGTLNTMPLINCTQPETILTSSVWQPDLRKTSFAYLLTRSGSLTNFPDCTIKQIVAAYGEPNATQIVAGTLASPAETLLFYDQGSTPKPVTAVREASNSTILPITSDQLPNTGCMGPTIMNIVAHEDDDLLFLSPDLQHEITAGDCMRTVFLTAGNDGQGRLYWLSRQLGSEAAYDEMIGSGQHVWVQRTLQLTKDQYVTVASPRDNRKISLLFMNLPDGNLMGEGFPMQHFESLTKLRSGAISIMHTVDGQSQYTSPQLVQALTQLMILYRPAEIHTQADLADDDFPDHSDHVATSQFTQSAVRVYDQEEYLGDITTPLRQYIGYPIQGYAPNVADDDLGSKEAAFFAYSRFDGSVCGSVATCRGSVYGRYLSRQYQR